MTAPVKNDCCTCACWPWSRPKHKKQATRTDESIIEIAQRRKSLEERASSPSSQSLRTLSNMKDYGENHSDINGFWRKES